MTLNKFITKLIVKGILLTLLIFVLGSVLPSLGTVITNHMALTQMENSDILYVLMNVYSNWNPVISAIIGIILVWIVVTIGFDTHKFIKTFENNKEN